jgi:hypothetical protein
MVESLSSFLELVKLADKSVFYLEVDGLVFGELNGAAGI